MKTQNEAATLAWDAVVDELVRTLGVLARLSAAATGEGEIVAQIQEGAVHVARAATLALPKSRYGRSEPGAVTQR